MDLKKYNYNLYLINLFLFINLVKSDSVLYLPVFVLVLAFLFNNKEKSYYWNEGNN